MRSFILVVVATLALGGSSAFASDTARSSEYQRLADQLTNYAERNAWPAVSRTFLELEALDGDPLTPSDLFIGAQGARALGDMQTCQRRLLRAFEKNISGAEDFDPRASQWLGEIQQHYGQVDIRHRGQDARLRSVDPPFQTDRRAAISFAADELEKSRRFEGLLPAGSYTLGNQTFEVEAGTESQRIRLRVRGE
ncbi:MAG: hypothetical protein EA397_13345 [Deltaproteobacteria bacterium]|nr:MAG: hypothetical protein EA397_13345 [Deltaproteobacteria bacterium]